jgi:periplasmic copper chaperone A
MAASARRRRLAAAALVAALPLTACSQDNPAANEGTEVAGGNAAPDEAVTEDVTVTALEIAFPEDGQWEEGQEVPLYAAIANSGTTPDRLIDVRGEDFGDARLVSRDATDGAIDVPEDDNVYLQPDGPPSVLLRDLGTPLRSAQAIPVTFVFEEAGEVTLDAMVAAAGRNPTPTVDFPDPDEDPTGDS